MVIWLCLYPAQPDNLKEHARNGHSRDGRNRHAKSHALANPSPVHSDGPKRWRDFQKLSKQRWEGIDLHFHVEAICSTIAFKPHPIGVYQNECQILTVTLKGALDV